MASFQKVNSFVEDICEEKHNFASDVLTVFMTTNANAPTSSTTNLASVTQISYTNLSSRVITTTSSSQTSGTYRLILTDWVGTASGAVATARFIGIYNETAPADEVVCYFDYGSDFTLASGETITLDFDGTNGLFSLA